MDDDLKALEEKITRLIGLCGQLRGENAQLRAELDASQQDLALIKAKMRQASERVETLMASLP